MNEQYNEQTSISLNRFFVMFMHGLKKLWFLVLVIMYVDGVADPAIIEELERRLDAVDIDGALSSGAIEAYITDRPR